MRFFGGLSRMPEKETVSTRLLFGNENENEGETENVVGSLPVFPRNAAPSVVASATTTTAAPLKTNALSATGKTKTKKVPKVYTAEEQAKINAATAKRKETQSTTEYKAKQAEQEAEREALLEKTKKLYGKLLHGKSTNGTPIPATPLEVVRIDKIWTKLIADANNNNEASVPGLADAIAAYKVEFAAKPKREKLGSAEKENRRTIRRKMRLAGVNPSMARLTAYRTKRANYNNINFKFNKNNTDKNRETKKKARSNLFTFLKGYASPELKGLRKAKANAKAALETFREAAEAELKDLRTEAQIKKGAGVNPASITHLAMLRQAGYRIKAKEFKELSTLVKKGEMAKLKDDPNMKSLITQSSSKDACDRCILNTIFGIRVK